MVHDTANADNWTWLWRGGITVIIILLFYFFKKWVDKIEVWQKKREKTEDDKNEGGGSVDRDQHFEWCTKKQSECIVKEGFTILLAWRSDILKKGGVLTNLDHQELCATNTEHLLDRIREMFQHHKEWATQEFNIQGVESEKNILKAIDRLRIDILKDNIKGSSKDNN